MSPDRKRDPHPYGGGYLTLSPLAAVLQSLNPRRAKTGGAFGSGSKHNRPNRTTPRRRK